MVCACTIQLHFILRPVLPSAELVQLEIQVAPDGDPTSEQPGGTLPSPQLPQPRQFQVRHKFFPLERRPVLLRRHMLHIAKTDV